MAYCPYCGTEIDSLGSICPNCGKTSPVGNDQQSNVYVPKSDERWLITLLLCFFLGTLGIHRFYTKNTTTGIVMLLTAGGCGIWTLIDFIMILLNTYKDGDGKLLK